MKKTIELNIMFTPWTIDTYQTFVTDSYEEQAIEYYNERESYEAQKNGTNDARVYTYDDFEWEYDHKGFVKCLADNWVHFMRENILDDVILAVELDGEPWSPRQYNFSTDNANIKFTVDYEKLMAYIEANREHYSENKIRGRDGFMWFGDDEQTALHYYLAHKSETDYPQDDYYSDQWDLLSGNGQIGEFINFEVTQK
jgi:hypothetical protein